MPFIHFTKKTEKCSAESLAENKKDKSKSARKQKNRDLCYCSHLDGYIYQHYSQKLNSKYNRYVKQAGFDKSVIAYRDNRDGKCNIHFAKEVIDFIRKTGSCYIFVGDFKGFFDNLDHKYLKNMMCKVLDNKKLADDWFAVFKNITKYSIFELNRLEKINNIKDYKELNKLPVVLSTEEFHKHKRTNLRTNSNNYGIPQGSPISAVLANVYMVEFDKRISDIATTNKGLYRRYSDDFIIVLPCNKKEKWSDIEKVIVDTNRIELQEDKTQVFSFTDTTLKNCNAEFLLKKNDKNALEYLGFIFDGEFVSLKDKTTTKFYYRMYRKIATIERRVKDDSSRRPDFLNLYDKYSKKGTMNFLTYVDRCIEVFDMNEKVHLTKIRSGGKLQRRINKIKQKRKYNCLCS